MAKAEYTTEAKYLAEVMSDQILENLKFLAGHENIILKPFFKDSSCFGMI